MSERSREWLPTCSYARHVSIVSPPCITSVSYGNAFVEDFVHSLIVCLEIFRGYLLNSHSYIPDGK